MRKHYILGLAVVLLFAVSFVYAGGGEEGGAVEKPVKVRMAHLFAESSSMGEKMTWVADQLEKRSNGRFECELFHGGTAGGEKENLEDLLTGNQKSK